VARGGTAGRMRAVVQDRYGPPGAVLRPGEIDRPTPGEGEVLVRVEASCVHPDVWHAVSGRPWVLRLMGPGFRRPKQPVPGIDVAGVVEAVGPGATRVRPGDEVFGMTLRELSWANGGAFAEYAVAPEASLAPKPPGVGFAEAGSMPTSGYIALLNLRGGAVVRPGGDVLVNGAGGNVGSVAVQVAKALGARVTGVECAEKLELVRSLGADRVVDCARERVLESGERYDLIFDVASNLSLRAAEPALKADGLYVLIGHDHYGRRAGRVLGSIPRVLGLFARARLLGNPHLKAPPGAAPPSVGEAMAKLAELLGNGRLAPVVARTYPLEAVPEAMRDLEAGGALGRLVITP